MVQGKGINNRSAIYLLAADGAPPGSGHTELDLNRPAEPTTNAVGFVNIRGAKLLFGWLSVESKTNDLTMTATFLRGTFRQSCY